MLTRKTDQKQPQAVKPTQVEEEKKYHTPSKPGLNQLQQLFDFQVSDMKSIEEYEKLFADIADALLN